MNPKCHICGSESKFLLNKDSFDLHECSNCKLVFVDPQPSSQNLAKDLYSYESGYQANRVEDLSLAKEQKRVKLVFDYFQKIKPGGKILDVGCANGQMLYWAKKRDFLPYGVELNKRTADHAKANGFEVFNGYLENAPFEENSFDFVFLGEIIEHVGNPREFIRNCSRLLKVGGIAAITTPNLDCFWSKATFKLYRAFHVSWSSVTPPYHLFQFSPHNLDILLKQESFSLAYKSFVLMSRLKYELGMLHLLKKFKSSKKIKDLLFMIFSFSLYVLVYAINIILHPFLKKDFNMVRIYKKEK